MGFEGMVREGKFWLLGIAVLSRYGVGWGGRRRLQAVVQEVWLDVEGGRIWHSLEVARLLVVSSRVSTTVKPSVIFLAIEGHCRCSEF